MTLIMYSLRHLLLSRIYQLRKYAVFLYICITVYVVMHPHIEDRNSFKQLVIYLIRYKAKFTKIHT